MGIMTRFLRLCRADIHGVMDQIEDKTLVLGQCLREMEDDIAKDKARLGKLNAKRGAAKISADEHTRHLEKIEQDITQAIKKQKDDIARFLIKKLKTVEGIKESLQNQITNHDRDMDRLKLGLEEKRLVYDKLKIQADTFISAKKNQELYEQPGFSMPGCESSEEEIAWELEKRKESLKGGDLV